MSRKMKIAHLQVRQRNLGKQVKLVKEVKALPATLRLKIPHLVRPQLKRKCPKVKCRMPIWSA